MLSISLVLLGLATTLATAKPVDLSAAIQIPVEKYALPNGLTVLLHPDPTVPQVTVQTWYKVGSKDEVPGRTGLAHFFEHMMFKGTSRYPIGTWSTTLKLKGAEYNASTSFDYTSYYITAAPENLPLLLDVESDRMRNLTLDPDEVNHEREVVKEERRMRYDDSIEGGIQEKIMALTFTALPYHYPLPGYMTDLNAASMDDLHAFYGKYYSPNNAILVVAGGIDVPETKRLIEKYYGGLPRVEITRPKITPEPRQTKARFATISREAQAPTVAIEYVTPPDGDRDNYAIDLLSIVLGQGKSSRLYRELVYGREMALATEAEAPTHKLAGEFMIVASLKPGIHPERALNLIESEVEKLRERPIEIRELEKARNIMMRGYVGALKRLGGRARILGHAEVVGDDYTRLFSDLKHYAEVTPQDVKRVAKAYLTPERRNVVTVVPRKAGGKK